MSFISYSFSSFITIEDDDDCIWSINEFVETDLNKDVWNVSWIFIDDDKSSWQTSLKIFFILYDSIILWSSLRNDRSILTFLMNNHIMSSALYSDEKFLDLSTCRFCDFWAFVNFSLMNSQMFFIFFVISDAFLI